MKRTAWLVILLFGGLWGLSEAVLGDALYAADVPLASVYLTVIAFFLLAVASVFLPFRGALAAIGVLAMLYKFFNVPFFACHLCGIALIGLSFDLVFRWMSRRDQPLTPVAAALKAILASYLSSSLFYLAMIGVFRSEHWLGQGLLGLWRHVGVTGTITAAGCALAVPLGLALGRRLAAGAPGAVGPRLQPRLAATLAALLAVGLWVYGVAGTL